MTEPMRFRAGFAALLLFTLGSLAAAPSPAQAKARAGVALFGGFNNFTMTDVNQTLITPLNQYLGLTGYSLKEIKSGWGVGAGLRVRPTDRLLVALDYERLFARSDLTIFMLSFDVDTPANAMTLTTTYLFPSSGNGRFGLSAGLGYYKSAGSVGIDTLGVATTSDLVGSGIGFHGLVSFDSEISPNVHFEGNAGIRYAKTTDVKVEGETILNADGSKATIDWTGLMTRAGLTFYFGER